MQRFEPNIPRFLRAETVYVIQVGSRVFKLSGASLSSDGPSYFTEKFLKEPQREGEVLFIDRCPDSFELICAHLQGYGLDVRDGVQFAMLMADAMYYDLPRLRGALQDYEYLFANVSGRTFKIARSVFRREGDSSNFFTLSSPQQPLYVGRSAELLQELLQWLGGASTELDELRRASLVAECRYYRFLNLEQRLLRAKVAYNPLNGSEYIEMRLQDLQEGCFEFPERKAPLAVPPQDNCCSDSTRESTPTLEGALPQLKRFKSIASVEKLKKDWNFALYRRPYVDVMARELIFQIDFPDCTLVFNCRSKTIHIQLASESARRFERLFSKPFREIGIDLAHYRVNNHSRDAQYGLPACISIAEFTVNGMKCPHVTRLVAEGKCDEKVINFGDKDQVTYSSGMQLHLTKSLWKLGVDGGNMILIALKAEAFAGTKEYCKTLNYL